MKEKSHHFVQAYESTFRLLEFMAGFVAGYPITRECRKEVVGKMRTIVDLAQSDGGAFETAIRDFLMTGHRQRVNVKELDNAPQKAASEET